MRRGFRSLSRNQLHQVQDKAILAALERQRSATDGKAAISRRLNQNVALVKTPNFPAVTPAAVVFSKSRRSISKAFMNLVSLKVPKEKRRGVANVSVALTISINP